MTEQQFEAIHAIARKHRSLSDIIQRCDYSLNNLKDRMDNILSVLGLHHLGSLCDESQTAELMQPIFAEIERTIESVKAKAVEEMRQMQLPKESLEVQP